MHANRRRNLRTLELLGITAYERDVLLAALAAFAHEQQVLSDFAKSQNMNHSAERFLAMSQQAQILWQIIK